MTGPLHVLSTLAVQGALPGLTAGFEQSAGVRVAADFAPTIGLLARIKAGEAADAAILTREGIDELVGLGLLSGATVVDLVQSLVGLAVKTGAAKPDISTQESLKRALLEARSIAYSRIGASGVWFARLIERLGIAEAVNAKAAIIPSGLTGELAARGETELAVQQLSELMLVPGIDVVGPLALALQTPAVFSAAVFTGSAHAGLARGFLQSLSSVDAAAAFTAAGLAPIRR
ncbi:MAG TPA: substrate-binding domain-containing protein [Hyphomicrobiaceae bacterium]|jgi:molybdate transport system substrate-binding protein|nr:substrate-binding domain-containing protein [Hyphomicrobiaceae bacterium]